MHNDVLSPRAGFSRSALNTFEGIQCLDQITHTDKLVQAAGKVTMSHS